MSSTDPKTARAYLEGLCEKLDRRQKPVRLRREWWLLVAPIPVALALGASACGGNVRQEPGGGTGAEVCDDGEDNDHDGKVDCADPDCSGQCGTPVYAAPMETCDDGVDNDHDALVDCQDPDCASAWQCGGEQDAGPFDGSGVDVGGMLYGIPVEICDDGVDNDGNGAVDCDDVQCATMPVCQGLAYGVPTEICDDQVDNDGDGAVDCDDADCVPTCMGDMYGAPIELCNDGIDNDGDGATDCADPDCVTYHDCGGYLYGAPSP